MRLVQLVLLGALLAATARPAAALELFGVELESAGRDELRAAVEDAGVVLLREGGDEAWFDVYDSAGTLPGAVRLYLGFVRQDRRFAFAEYEFTGLAQKRLLRDLRRKYGEATTRGGRFISDRSYHWQRDGIEISLVCDWAAYRTRLSYVAPAGLAALLAERQASTAAQAGEPRAVSLF